MWVASGRPIREATVLSPPPCEKHVNSFRWRLPKLMFVKFCGEVYVIPISYRACMALEILTVLQYIYLLFSHNLIFTVLFDNLFIYFLYLLISNNLIFTV